MIIKEHSSGKAHRNWSIQTTSNEDKGKNISFQEFQITQTTICSFSIIRILTLFVLPGIAHYVTFSRFDSVKNEAEMHARHPALENIVQPWTVAVISRLETGRFYESFSVGRGDSNSGTLFISREMMDRWSSYCSCAFQEIQFVHRYGNFWKA